MVIVFSGKIGSGKSAVSSLVASQLEFVKVSFGDYVRASVSAKGGDPLSRKELQDEGQRQVEASPKSFLSSTLKFHDWDSNFSVVVDGLRHTSVLSAMRDHFKDQLFHIHLEVVDTLATERALERGDEQSNLEGALERIVEPDVSSVLRLAADLVLDAEEPIEILVAACTSATKALQR